MKKYTIHKPYRGLTITVQLFAKTNKEAADILGVSPYALKQYAGIVNVEKAEHDGVMAWMDSGWIICQYGRKDLHNKKMPIAELYKIIDHYIALKNSEFQKSMASKMTENAENQSKEENNTFF